MAYKIIYSEEIRISLTSILYYLENRWSHKVAQDFFLIFLKKVENLSRSPNTGSKTGKNPDIRKTIITKHNILYYSVKNDRLELLDIFFAKRNPKKNTFE
jgi:plasmid stabilization system protein ParE